MRKHILYLGDTALDQAASYLAGVLTHYELSFDYLPSDHKLESPMLQCAYRAVILSDYPAANLSGRQMETLTEITRKGTGLLMIGGWESFSGPNREYTDTPLREVLPVVMQNADDRINCDQPCLIEKVQDHPIIDPLPLSTRPPTIGGFNRIRAKPSAQTILAARRFNASGSANGFLFQPLDPTDPLLVVGAFGQGRTAAFASDVAPHWVGGLVDWGNSRLSARAEGGSAIEVGNWYAEFFANLVRWTAKLL